MNQPTSCDHPELRPIEDAQALLIDAIAPISASILKPIGESLGYVLATDVLSTLQVPSADNSAMDGYAVNVDDLQDDDTLTLIGTSYAGAPYEHKLAPGTCVRITTGGVIPEGANGVMMQENVELSGDRVKFLVKPKLGQSIRKAGENIDVGQVVAQQGTLITPAHIGLFASLGLADINVVRKLKIAVLSTGNELKSPPQTLTTGDVYDSNRPAIIAALIQFGAEVIDLGIIPDDKQLLKDAFEKADNLADAIVTSGGVSVGDADYTKEVLEEAGEIEFWKLAIKPGKPFAFGRLAHSLFFGLPGNPVSAMVTLNQLVLPALQKYRSAQPLQRLTLSATSAELFKKRPGRTDYQRAVYWTEANGTLMVKPCGPQGSGIFTSITQANCFAILARQSGDVEVGQRVTIQPFDSFIA